MTQENLGHRTMELMNMTEKIRGLELTFWETGGHRSISDMELQSQSSILQRAI